MVKFFTLLIIYNLLGFFLENSIKHWPNSILNNYTIFTKNVSRLLVPTIIPLSNISLSQIDLFIVADKKLSFTLLSSQSTCLN